MHPPARIICGFLAAVLAATPPAPSYAAEPAGSDPRSVRPPEPTAEAMIFDGIVARPAGLAATVLGAGLFIVTLPFSAAGGNVEQARERFIDEPVWYTFRRCLGCFDGAYDRSQPPEAIDGAGRP